LIEGLGEPEPVEAGNLALEIQLGITRVTTVLWCDNPIEFREFLSKYLVSVRQNQELVVLNCVVSRGKALGF